MLLIGLGYKARQGKDTAGAAILNAMPLGYSRVYKFAEALRKEVRKAALIYGGYPPFIEAWKEAGLMPDWVHPEEGKERSLYQWYGTDYRRAKDPNYWVKRLDETLTKEDPEAGIITDVRFPNEAEYIRARGGYLIEVTRLGEPDIKVQDHASEHALAGYKWDYALKAETVDELRKKAVAIYREIRADYENR